MLRIVQNTSAAGAKQYYSTADYYAEGQELEGTWAGLGAERLGLVGSVGQPAWEALCDNRYPGTEKTLTARQKSERRVGYDFNFHVPKSVSLLYALTRDERILEAFRESVRETMKEMESEMKCRVRKGGRNEDRISGNMVWGEFIHFTARPVDGVPDPHLHAHCFVFNTTYDPTEDRWKAGQFADLKRDASYFEALFHSRFARALSELGLCIERKEKGWELASMPKSALARFSRRTAAVEAEADAKGVIDPKEKAELGAKTRSRKAKNLTLEALRRIWSDRLTAPEQAAIAWTREQIGGPPIPETPSSAEQAVELATDHCFERQSVVPERKLLADALKRSVGDTSHAAVAAAFQQKAWIKADRAGMRLVTTPEVLAEESKMIAFAREGRGTCSPFRRAVAITASGEYSFRRAWLNRGQKNAVLHVLNSQDRVTLIRGAAGTGKTSMMLEAVEAIGEAGRKVFTFAPSADASRGVLRDEGFKDAETISRLLVDTALQEQAKGEVVWVDEAGLLSTQMMKELFDLAERINARVILSGDRKQHGSVERGSALRLLEEEAGLIPATLTEINRQKADYKQAIEALSEGRTFDGFASLDGLGWIKEAPDAERYRALASDYIRTIHIGESALVVSPTHREADRITTEIRSALREAGRLATDERSFPILKNANFTQVERADTVNYTSADKLVLEFHQNTKGFRKGQRVAVGGGPLPLDKAPHFQTYRRDLITADRAPGSSPRSGFQ